MKTHRSIRILSAGVLAAVALLIAACGGGSSSDKAGGTERAEPITLTLANGAGEPPPQLTAWAEEVNQVSDGTIEVEFENDWRQGEADFEAGTIDDVRAGDVDLAWVGARAFDTVGVTSFQALVAPLLIDSYDLEEAVFEEGIPTEMLDGLDPADLVGIGVLPGPMRKPLGITKPFAAPTDYTGAVVGMQDSAVAEQTLVALGATPQAVPGAAALDGLDAYEQQLASVVGNHYSTTAEYVTTNVNLWPRPLVLVMNPDAYAALTTDQQSVLRDASAAAVPDALQASRDEDDQAVPELCREGMTLAVASGNDLTDLRAALEPVYDDLATDHTTSSFIDDITKLKADLSAPPEAPECPARDPERSSETGFPGGTYEMTLTLEEITARCGTPEEQARAEAAPTIEILQDVTFDAGSVKEYSTIQPDGVRDPGFFGTYTVFRDRIELADSIGTISAKWSFDGTNLTFTDIDGTCDDEAAWGLHPWTQTTTPDASG